MISDVARVAPLKLVYKPDAAEAQERMRAFWSGEMIDRPCISIKTPKDGVTPPRLPQILAPDFDFDAGVARFEEWASCVFFGGEAIPALLPTWGPDQFAAFVGADIVLSPDEDTSWAVPFVENWDDVLPLGIDPENRWWKGTIEFTRVAARAGDGRFLLCTLDMHSNADCLSAVRGPAELCMDLLQRPEQILRAMEPMNDLYRMVYDGVFDAGRMAERGSTSWLDMWSDGRTEVVECDFSCMVSPELSRRFILPWIEFEVSYLDRAMYHLDGVTALPHLDDLFAIPGLHGIQWVQGAGEAPMPEWIWLLQKIQRAGKSVHITVTEEELKAVHPELLPDKTFYSVADCPTEAKARELIRWLESHV